MKTILSPLIFTLAIAFNAAAQEQPPAQILPGFAQPPMPAEPEEFFPEDMHIDPHGEFGPGEMFMPDMPGRYQIISAQLQQNGKAVPIVLKLDTQTGQVWQLKSVFGTLVRNGKRQTFSRLTFEPVDPGEHPQPLQEDPEPDAPGFGIDGGESIPEEAPQIEPAPERIPADG